MKKIIQIAIIVFSIAQISCDRAKKENNTLTLSVISDKSQPQYTALHPMWGGVGPTVSALADINCFFVMVSSLDTDPWMHRNNCKLNTGEILYFGPMFGFFKRTTDTLLNDNTEFIVNLPSGPQRLILLGGVKVSDSAQCHDLSQGGFSPSLISDWYLIGSATLDLIPGQDVAKQMTMSWTGSNKFVLPSTCQFYSGSATAP